MKRYLVKRTMIARDTNSNRPGHVEVSISGRDCITLFYEGSGSDFDRDYMTAKMIELHGHKRVCDAKRCWAYKCPEVEDYWVTKTEVLTYEVANGKFEQI